MARRIRGDKALARQLDRLATDVPKKAETAVVAGALVIQNGGKRRAPYVTGTLRRSIHIGGHEDLAEDFRPNERLSGAEPVPKPEKTRKGVTAYTGTDLEYARAVEEGARGRRPQPYLRSTAEEDGPEARREVADAFRDLIRNIA